MGGEEGVVEEVVDIVVAAGADGLAVLEGEEKKEVMVALAFGFFAAEVAMSPALRLRGVAMTRRVSKTQLIQLMKGKGRLALEVRAL